MRIQLPDIVIASVLVLLGCPRGGDENAIGPNQRVRVQSYSETSAVRLLVATGAYLFSAPERGLIRWSLDNGQSLTLSAEHGLPGDRVEAMAYDASRDWLWLATDGGMTRYEVDNRIFTELKPPPSILGLSSLEDVALAPAVDGGLWIGHRHGLYYTNTESQWTDTGITEPVTALRRTGDGWLWIGLHTGLVARKPDGDTIRFGPAQGCNILDVRLIAEAPAGGAVAVGTDEDGKERVALTGESSCTMYRSSPGDTWLALERRGDELLILTRRRAYRASASPAGARILSRSGMRLVPVTDNRAGAPPPPRSPYVIRALELPLPPLPNSLAVGRREVFIGTEHLGTARLDYREDQPRRSWLRQSLLVRDAHYLAVACESAEECYVATGAPQAWRYTSAGFSPMKLPGGYPLAFARSPGGYIVALVRSDDDRRVEVYRKARDRWRKLRQVEIEVPGAEPQVTFARFSPEGELWVGLQYEDEGVGTQFYGVAVVDVEGPRLQYHHQAFAGEKSAGLALPLEVKDAAFLDEDEVWLATGEGAVQIRGDEVTVHNEANKLGSELPRGLARSSGGLVFIATRDGVAAYNGETWEFIGKLHQPANDIDVGNDGRLWLATNRGVAVYDGAHVHRLDKRRGLIENRIAELQVDHMGRVWARGTQGITILTP